MRAIWRRRTPKLTPRGPLDLTYRVLVHPCEFLVLTAPSRPRGSLVLVAPSRLRKSPALAALTRSRETPVLTAPSPPSSQRGRIRANPRSSRRRRIRADPPIVAATGRPHAASSLSSPPKAAPKQPSRWSVDTAQIAPKVVAVAAENAESPRRLVVAHGPPRITRLPPERAGG